MKRTIKLIGALVIASALMVGGVFLVQENVHKKTNIQKTLAETIADNIRQHPNDWVLTKDNTGEGYVSTESLTNKRCGIQLDIMTSQYQVGVYLFQPDRVSFDAVGCVEILTAYHEAISQPLSKQREQRQDSINKVEQENNRINEAAVLSKICKY